MMHRLHKGQMAKGKTYWGAPHVSVKRSVPNAPTKTQRFESGFYPGSMSARETAEVIGLDQVRPGIDTPVTDHGQQPDRHGESKAAAVAGYENAHPDLPRGTLGR